MIKTGNDENIQYKLYGNSGFIFLFSVLLFLARMKIKMIRPKYSSMFLRLL